MSNEVQIFSFEGVAEVRTVEIDGEPRFLGSDVARALEHSNPSKALADHVDPEDQVRATLTIREGSREVARERVLINESGLYALIFGSKLESAKRFKRWVTAEVLPTIRKTGGAYVAPDSQAEMDLLNPDTALDTIERLTTLAREQRAKIAELEPPAKSMMAIRKAVGGYTRYMLWREAQDTFGMTDVKQHEFNTALMRRGVTAPFGPGSKFKIEPEYREWSDDWQFYDKEYEEWRINSNPHFNEAGVQGVMSLFMHDEEMDNILRSL